MAGRFMRIKRIVIPFMTLVLLTSQLAGCAMLNSQEMMEEIQKTPEVILEYNELDTGQQSLDASHVADIGDQQIVTDTDDDSSIGVINTSNEEKQELSGDELIQYFKIAYIGCTAHTMHFSLEDAVNFELDYIKIIANRDDQLLPFDYADQYRAWRPVDVQEASQQQSTEATLTFTDCNETVYATGTVNLRSGPDTSYDKVGSLNKGNSVIRTGIGTGDYSSWSRVRLSDGSEVYVASNYLSTVKPAATSNNNGSNISGNSNPQSGLDSQSSSKPASGGLDIYGSFNTYEEYIEDLQRKLPHLTLEQIKEAWPDQATLHVDEAVYNQDIKDNLLHN